MTTIAVPAIVIYMYVLYMYMVLTMAVGGGGIIINNNNNGRHFHLLNRCQLMTAAAVVVLYIIATNNSVMYVIILRWYTAIKNCNCHCGGGGGIYGNEDEPSINPNATNYTNASNITQEQLIVNESTSESYVEGIDHTNSTNYFVNCTFDDEYIVNDEDFARGETEYKMHRKVSIYLTCPLFSSLYHSLLVTTPLSPPQ